MSHAPPLVSIIIYNYNYGRFLHECIESVLTQTYQNIEILFSDNASTDNSWDIALEYSRNNPDIFFLAKNRSNFGQTANHKNCFINIRGKYYVVLGSDDLLHPDFLSRTTQVLESNLDAGFAMTHRTIINQNNEKIEERPFYNQNCKIPPPLQAEVYMMAAVNPSISQVIYRTDFVHNTPGVGNRYHGARILDFNIACQHAMLYLKEPLVYHRVHLENDAKNATENLIDIIGPYLMNFDFCETANAYGYPSVSQKLAPSIKKNARLSLRYAANALINQNTQLAKRYYHLALALSPEVETDALYLQLTAYWQDETKRELIQEKLANQHSLQRTVSYDPPVGSILLN
jgi:glycosyltransferase involved in cell wall biosynthesis